MAKVVVAEKGAEYGTATDERQIQGDWVNR